MYELLSCRGNNPHILGVLVRLLPQLGFDVVTASSGRAAAALLAADPNTFSLALVDIRMPELDGPATVRLLRSIKPGLAICLLSGSLEIDIDHLDDLCVAGVISKPFTPDRLGQVLWQALRESQTASEG